MSSTQLTQSIQLTVAGQTFTIGNDGTGKATYTINSSTTLDATLISLRYRKKIYKPGYICAVIQTGDISNANLISLFNNQKASLIVNLYKVATDYIVFCSEPVYKKDSGSTTSVYVTLHIYSPDYWMTMDKYSKCYVHKQLGAGILEEEAPNFGFTITTDTVTGNVDCSNLTFLNYTYTGDNDTDVTKEFIQPYLVQFNESFFDFMARTANRCGEFFFYENGKLYLGTPTTDNDKGTLSSYDSVTFRNRVSGGKVTVSDSSRNYATEGRSNASADSYKLEMTSDENLEPLKKNNAIKMSTLYGDGGQVVARTVFSALSQKNLYDAVTIPLTNEALSAAQAGATMGELDATYNKKFLNADNYATEQWEDYKSDGSKVSQFSNYTKSEAKNVFGHTNLNTDFYSKIKALETQKAQQTLCADLGTTYQNLLLGNTITFSGTKYTVTEVSGIIGKDETTGEWTANQKIEAVPMVTPDATPTTSSVYYPCPFPLPSGSIRQSKPQVAYVTANNDPQNMGRVRIRYPWQQKPSDDTYANENDSPWIRVATPFTVNGGGACFRLQVGEEVMLDYEDGNIERPFVAGSLFSADSPTSPYQSLSNVELSSPNGHYIRMSTPGDSTKMITNLVPVLSLVKGFTGGVSWDPNGNTDRRCAGGIELGDYFGFVNINMSTDKRNISITSSLGTVNINAFHGITISAPNGTIKMSAKNIEISASNNLTLTSGTNVKTAQKGITENIVQSLTGDVLRFLDISILRTVFEVFIRPIEGSLLIKSHRFMQLEAGVGTTTIPVNSFSDQDKSQQSDDDQKFRLRIECVKRTVLAVVYNINHTVEEYFQMHNDIVFAANHYTQLIRNLNAKDKLKDDATAEGLLKKAPNSNPMTICTEDNLLKDKNDLASKTIFRQVYNAALSLCTLAKDYNAMYDNLVTKAKLWGNDPIPAQVFQEFGNFYFDEANSVIGAHGDLIKEVCPKYDAESFKKRITVNEKKLTVLRRKMVNLVLDAISVQLNDDEKIIDYPVGGNSVNVANDKEWAKHVMNIKFYRAEKNAFVKALTDVLAAGLDFKDSFDHSQWGSTYETAKWGTEKTGKILLSDEPSKTVSIDNGTLTTRHNTGDSVLHQILKNL